MLSPVEEIKSRLDIVEVIQGYLRLAKAGVNYRALCPFHTEKTPSFFVSPSRQSWHCFGGCDTGGDIISFVEKIEGVEFREALRLLAERAGVRLAADNPHARSEREKLLAILEEAAKFYEGNLGSTEGQSARAYLGERGLRVETINAFRLGYAPNDWRALLGHLTEIGFGAPDIEKAGLIIKKADTKYQIRSPLRSAPGSPVKIVPILSENTKYEYYDRFRHRIMFPLFDLAGRVVGFTGRVMPGTETETPMGKYVNTPQTAVFDKGKLLYGLHFAKTDIRKSDHCVIVEGQMDCLMSHQAGIKNAVAVSGTAFTPWHLQIVKRYTDKLLFAFDMDVAGENATKRAVELALASGFGVKIIQLTRGKDAADIVAENPTLWQEAVEQATSLMDFYFEAAFRRNASGTPEGKKNIADALLPVIGRIPHAVEQAHWLGRLGERLGVREEDLRVELAKVRVSAVGRAPTAPAAPMPRPPKTRRERLVEELAAYLCRFPECEAILNGGLPEGLEAEIQKRKADEAILVRSDFIAPDPLGARAEVEALVRELAGVAAHDELAALQGKLRQEERAGKWEEVKSIAQSIRLVTEKLKR